MTAHICHPGNRHSKTRDWPVTGRKDPFPSPQHDTALKSHLVFGDAVQSPEISTEAALMPSCFLCPILLPPLSFKHWFETTLGWTLHANHLYISFCLTTLWQLYNPGPLGLSFLLTPPPASWLYKPRLNKREEIHPPHLFPQVSWKTGSFHFL